MTKRFCLNNIENWNAITDDCITIENLMENELVETTKNEDGEKVFYTDDIETYEWHEKYANAIVFIKESLEDGTLTWEDYNEWTTKYYTEASDYIYFAEELKEKMN